jgi:hypothetical protein
MAALTTAVLLIASASGSYDAAMAKAVALYNEAEWDAALRELTIAEKFAASEEQKLKVWVHEGIMLANVPDADAAKAAWVRALKVDPKLQLPLAVSPRVKAMVQEAQKLAEAARKAERDAPRQVQLTPQDPGPRPAYDGQPSFPLVPIISLGVGVVAGGLGLGFALGANSLLAAARNPALQGTPEPDRLKGQAATYSTIANVAFAVAGAAALTALITFIVID